MATRYFKKHNPNVKLFLKCTGGVLHFQQVDKFGYLKSDDPQIGDNPSILDELDTGMRNQVGGVIEISAAQYDAAIKKKALSQSFPGSSPSWREEISAARPLDTLGIRVLEPAAVASQQVPSSQETTSAPQVRSLRERANLGIR